MCNFMCVHKFGGVRWCLHSGKGKEKGSGGEGKFEAVCYVWAQREAQSTGCAREGVAKLKHNFRCNKHTRTHAAEEAKWRAELRQREADRMAVLEGEWRRRERAREAEAASLRAEYAALEERTRQVRAVHV